MSFIAGWKPTYTSLETLLESYHQKKSRFWRKNVYAPQQSYQHTTRPDTILQVESQPIVASESTVWIAKLSVTSSTPQINDQSAAGRMSGSISASEFISHGRHGLATRFLGNSYLQGDDDPTRRYNSTRYTSAPLSENAVVFDYTPPLYVPKWKGSPHSEPQPSFIARGNGK